MAKTSVVLIGDESLLVQCGEILLQRGHGIALVVTSSPPIRDWALETGIDARAWENDLSAVLHGVPFDWLFSIANRRVIPDDVLSMARSGAVNFHDGPLPRYAGLNAPSWAIMEGADAYGVTWHDMAGGIDAGAVRASRAFEIAPDETVLTLNAKCFEAGIASFADLIAGIETGMGASQPQPQGHRVLYRKAARPTGAGLLDLRRSATDLSRLYRALDFGARYTNPLVTAKIATADRIHAVTALTVLDWTSTEPAGTVIAKDEAGLVVATADHAIRIEGKAIDGSASLVSDAVTGQALPLPDPDFMHALDGIVARIVPNEAHWLSIFPNAHDLDMQWTGKETEPSANIEIGMPDTLSREDARAAIVAFFARYLATSQFAVAWTNDELAAMANDSGRLVAGSVPVCLDIDLDAGSGAARKSITDAFHAARRKSSFLTDIFLRNPGTSRPELSLGISELADTSRPEAIPGCALTFTIGGDGRTVLVSDSSRVPAAQTREMADRLAIFAAAFATGEGPVGDMPVMSETEMRRLMVDFNDTAGAYDRDACLHDLIERQARATPDAVAVAFAGQEMTYRGLDEAAGRVAAGLRRMGVAPDGLVGLHVRRSIELVVGALGILKAGAAYLPLDPDFPADRLAMMVEDSGAAIVLTQDELTPIATGEGIVSLDIASMLDSEMAIADRAPVRPENLAYVIYTSGSTGRPKGVMIEHRNVVNFFAGMDRRVPFPAGAQPVWLAVTSLSFDIAVLELFWTLSRGFKVVIHTSEVHRAHRLAAAPARAREPTARPMDFGLFYWGNDDGAGPAKYRLLLEGAKFADAHGFQAIWTPERHFHAFGGPYPNPAVTGAAVAAVTRNLDIRAGSCVLPLHHPARVVEEWSVVDNLSNGRIGLAFASGWMPEDFVLRPENAPPANKGALTRDIESVRRLWRGERVDFAVGDKAVSIVTQPRPVQKELPLWLTTAGNPDTYREAAQLGVNVLTHLLGQSIEELAGKIAIYRETVAASGRDPADYKVTLMLHTLLGEDREEVREIAREPMKDYLRSAAALIKQYAWAFPAFKKPAGVSQAMDIDLRELSEDEMDAILEFAFQRYFDESGLFGTVEDAQRRIDQLRAIGVDEVACLIDYGVDTDIVLERLQPLARLVAGNRRGGSPVRLVASEAPSQAEAEMTGFAGDVLRHGVTHLQCTPSMARMFLADEENRRAMGRIDHLMIGGEPLSGALYAQLRSVTDATIENMYGPTETTIWSSTLTAGPTDGIVPLGNPILNTQFYVLDRRGKPVPAGMAGELHIGGDGVARGYLGRPELTRERFLDNPFGPGRIYRTGDLVRFEPDSRTLRFIGRTDHQVKVRGYRIELGEIEARIQSFPGIVEAVAVTQEARHDDRRIVAYMRVSSPVDQATLRMHVAAALPDYMVPSRFIELDRFPLTPNAKVDRARLPQVAERPAPSVETIQLPPRDDREQAIAQAFARALGLERVGLTDNFFALGGHSLLAVHLHRDIKATIAPEITITDIFRFPTVAGLSGHLGNRSAPNERLNTVADRAAMRRARMQRTAAARH
jgi:natural product biosynthesis luciferase-like monooxygenase protein